MLPIVFVLNLLTEAIEWFTQLHYLSGFKDGETLDPLFRESVPLVGFINRDRWIQPPQSE